MKEILIVIGVSFVSIVIFSVLQLRNVETNWEKFVRSQNRLIDQRIEAQSQSMNFESL